MNHSGQYPVNIIVVDDEPRMCESLKYLLGHQKFNVRTALTGSDALQWVSREEFDIAVLDIGLPDIDGIQLMEYIRSTNRDICFVIITGNATLDSALKAIRNGAFDYLKKPFEYDQLLNTINNILNQRKLQKENIEINGKLASSEERYRYLVKNSPDIIYILDENGRFEYISDAVQSLLGYDPQGLIGEHFSTIVMDEDKETCKWFFQERRTGERATSGAELKLRVTGNGTGSRYCEIHNITVELKSTGIYAKPEEKGRRFLGTHGVARDISRRKRLERQVKQMERMEAMGTLSAGIAHNFNNLLMAIQGNASLVLLDLDDDSEHTKRLKNIIEYTQNGADLTSQLLGFARSTEYEIKSVDINDIVTKSSTMFGKTRKEISVREELASNLWCTDTDDKQMQQVLLNLYVNAWHAMPEGGDLILRTENTVVSETSPDFSDLPPGRYVKITVEDTGTGIDDTVLPRIFEPFFTTKEVGKGTGLGLTSAFGTVKNLGGTIQVKSCLGKGTTFFIYLPASEQTNPSRETGQNEIVKGNGLVLLLDDEDMIIEVGSAFIKALGYNVITASNAREAIDIYREKWREIDLVILDMIMPEMDGGKVFDNLKQINPDIRAILSSGHGLDGRCQKVFQKGFKGFAQKPFNLSDLSILIRDVLCK